MSYVRATSLGKFRDSTFKYAKIFIKEYIFMRGKAMASYPWELAQDAAYQSHTSRLTELWCAPRTAQGLNTNNNDNNILYVLVI